MATSYLLSKRAAKPKKPAPLLPPPPPAADPKPTGAQQDYDHFLPAAKSLDHRDLRPFRADASLAYHNIQRGLSAILEHEDRLKEDLPKLNINALRDLPRLALAVGFAASQVDRSSAGTTTLAPLLRRAHELRDILLTSADALAKASVLPARAVAKIREGRGPIDAAQDCIDLAALFTKHAEGAKGKTAVTAAQTREAAKLGTELLTLLKPKSAKRDKSGPPGAKDAAAIRDRMWTLLVKGYQDLRRAGMWLWVDDVDKHVPPLQSRAAPPRKQKPKEP